MENIGVPPPSGPPMISADGFWMWNGAQWVPRLVQSTYRPARRPAGWVVALLGIWIVSAALLMIADLTRISIADAITNGSSVSLSQAQNSDAFVRIAAGAHLAALVVTGIAFLVWLHRVVANNYGLGARQLRFTPGWAVGWWFVPFANLVRAFQVVLEAWRAANPTDLVSTEDTRARQGFPLLLAAWWFLYLLGNLIAAFERVSSTDPVTTLRSATQIDIASIIVSSVAALLAITLVVRLTGRQEARAKLLGQ